MMPRSVLVFRTGSLGDTLVAVPALWRVREQFPRARITLLCDSQPGGRYVVAADLLAGAGLVDDVLRYPLDRAGGRARQYLRMAKLLLTLRRRRFDALVYLIASGRSSGRLERDRRFFRAAGIPLLIGFEGMRALPVKVPGEPLSTMPREAELLLNRLEAAGMTGHSVRRDIAVNATDRATVVEWLRGLPSDGGRPWIAIGPGSRMPAKVWPEDRYEVLVRRLIERFDIWPVVFGDATDAPVGERLLTAWGRGFNAAGKLGVRPAIAAVEQCRLYLGNDTGTMHMAASAGVRCVAVFCAHAPPGLWYPLGEGHAIFRTTIDCEGCGLTTCIERRMECVTRVQAADVLATCERFLLDPVPCA